MAAPKRTNSEWLEALTATGPQLNAALDALRIELHRAMLAYLATNCVARQELHIVEARFMAEDCVQDTLLLIQQNLAGFRGDSQFMTWAYAIALRRLLAELRSRRWKKRALDADQIGRLTPTLQASSDAIDGERLHQRQKLWELLIHLIDSELSDRQRVVLVGHTIQDVPLDVVAQRLGTHRDNAYKILHDARKKLKKALEQRNLHAKDFLSLFS